MSLVVGLAACGVSAGLFGSMFVPVRKYDAGDGQFRAKNSNSNMPVLVIDFPSSGFFAQWVMSTAILFVGFVMHAIKGFPAFYPLAMIGGACWTIGIR